MSKSKNDSELRNLLVQRFMEKVQLVEKTGCWRWIASTQNADRDSPNGIDKTPKGKRIGRGCMLDPTTIDPATGRGKIVAADRIAWRLFYSEDPIPKGYRPVPSCDTPMCMRHLKLSNRRRVLSGEAHPRAAINDRIAGNLQRYYKPRSERVTLAVLAKRYAKYGISRQAVRNIVHGKSNGGVKVPHDVVLKMREEYEPARQLAEFLPPSKKAAKSTLASAASGRTWKSVAEATRAREERAAKRSNTRTGKRRRETAMKRSA